jgi:hypothetical protein
MPTRGERLKWCKDRALEILDGGDIQGAFASMTIHLQKWTAARSTTSRPGR